MADVLQMPIRIHQFEHTCALGAAMFAATAAGIYPKVEDAMAAMGGGMGFYGNMPDNYKVIVNGNHKLISRILQEENEEVQAQLSKQAFDLALLSQGLLTGAELTEFVNRSVNLI